MPTHSTLSPIDATTKALDALLCAIEGRPAAGAIAAYRAAIVRHGRNLVTTVGPSALADVQDRVAAMAPERAQERREAISAAWETGHLRSAHGPP